MSNIFAEFVYILITVFWQILTAIISCFIPASRKDVSNEIVLITGAGSGLGRLMALRFASLGSTVVCVDINTQANESTANQIKSEDGKAFAFTCDCSSREDIYRVAEDIKASVGDVTILVNNAGIVSGKKFMDCSDGLIEKTFEVNTLAHYWTTKAFLPAMFEKNSGHIVSIASSAGLFGVTGLCDYCSSKFGAYGFNESLQMELAAAGKNGIATTVVCPFFINTGMFDGVQTRFPLLLPILEPDYAVNKIMSAILSNQRVLLMPRILYLLLILKSFLPQVTYITLSDFFGASNTMDHFKGRAGKKSD
ncbi:epidermal retinol dehydrogenase 2-like isoform X1 [Xenia sp. Carnegie-2017]|uniref:epidermal retinol dehydrogenase 2-like isoform X1 n=2 Tax=Xenia sp. Carnegie-2017 TaxID=2897299 RepID=UPI001F037CDA|nr:epidermal retinol dehydrogenase 2-like isoform X1 [Xenia sp. Carnegie-2017]